MQNSFRLLPLILFAFLLLQSQSPQDVQMAKSLGKVAWDHYQEGRNEQAMEVINQAIELDAHSYTHFITRGLISSDLFEVVNKNAFLTDQEVCRIASEDLWHAHEMEPDSLGPLRYLTSLAYRCNDYGDLFRSSRIWLSLTPYADDSCVCYSYLHRVHFRPEMDNPFEYLDSCLAIQPNNLATLTTKALTLRRIGRTEEAIEIIRQIWQAYPEDTDALMNLGFMLLDLEDYVKADKILTQVIEMDPENGYAYSNRSQARLHLGKVEAALADIEKSLELFPSNSWAFKNRGLIYLEMGELDKACADWRTALDMGYSVLYDKDVDELLREHCR